jgi:hypothetical protein
MPFDDEEYDPRWNPEQDWLMTSPYAPPQLKIETDNERELVSIIRRATQAQVDETFRLATELTGVPLPTYRRRLD